MGLGAETSDTNISHARPPEILGRRLAIVDQLIKLLDEYATLGPGERIILDSPIGACPVRNAAVVLVSAEPMVVEGFRSLLSASALSLAGVYCDVTQATAQMESIRPSLVILHSGAPDVLDAIPALRARAPQAAIVLCLERISMDIAGRAVASGVRGILPTTSPPDKILDALYALSAGEMRLELPSKFCRSVKPGAHLSKGQLRLLALVGQGLKNKEIAAVLDSTEGTVKTSLNRLLKTLGLKDRLEVALYAMEIQATASMASVSNELIASQSAPIPRAAGPKQQIGTYGTT